MTEKELKEKALKYAKEEFVFTDYEDIAEAYKDGYEQGIIETVKIQSSIQNSYIADLKQARKENAELKEKIKHISNICDIILDGATNWDSEQLEEFVKQIQSFAK